MKKLLAFSNIVCFLFACAEDSLVMEDPIAEFSFQFFGDCSSPILEIRFTNTSKNADSYFWDFGDGTFSEEENPTKIYAKAGKYTVKLRANNAAGEGTALEQITLTRNSDGTGPILNVAYDQDPENFFKVEFTITIQGATSIRWAAGDGGAPFETTLVNPDTVIYLVHNFPEPGRYSVYTNATGNDGCACNSITLYLSPFGG